MKNATAARSLPDLIAAMKQHVMEDMTRGDITAEELVDHLDIAWCAAERWRIEQWDPEFEHSETTAAFS